MSDLFKISPSLLEAIKGVQKEENEFQAKVRAHMAKKGIKSLGELTPEEKKKFFNEIDAMHQAKNEEFVAESDGPVVWKKGEHSIEKLDDGKFAVYMGDKKGKTFSSLEDAKASISEEVGGGTTVSSVKTVVAQKKRAALAQKIADAKEKHAKEMEKLRGQKSNVKEEFDDSFLDEAFSPAMVAKLKAEYGKISSIDPSSDSYKKLIAMLDKMDKKDLQTLADAGIKFVSGLARNRVNRMKNEEVEQVEEAKSEPSFRASYGLNKSKDAPAKITSTIFGKRVKGKGYGNEGNVRKAPEGNVAMTSMMPGHDERAAKFLARQAKGTLVKGKAQSATQKEEVEQVDELTSVEPKAKKEKEFVDAHTIAVKDSGDSKLPESDKIKPAQGKRNADKLDNKQKFGEETFSEKLKRIIFEKKEKNDEVKNKEKALKKGEALSGKKEPIEINPEISEK
jgi:hypothetical protein